MTEAESHNSSSMVGRTIAGRYTIRATIGSGGMGFVYRATQAPIEREVALKVLRLDLAHQEGIAERFTREARAASRIQHPNAITIFEFGEDDGIFYLAMELLYGETLRQRMRREPRLEPEHALDIFEAMAGALAAAHRVGVIHRDLKPDNIFLAQFDGIGEVVKVLDFGLAKLLDRAADSEGLVTDVNLRLGTPRYMAPEQALGLQPIDARCDVYSLGLLLFEMLAGRAPFVGDDGMEVLAQRLRREAPRVSQVAPERRYGEKLDELIAGMLERDRERRPADANEVITRLRELRKAGLCFRRDDSLLDIPTPDVRTSNPGGGPRARRNAAAGGYPVHSGGYPKQSAVPAPPGGLDDFDKPTVVIPNREEFTPSEASTGELTPLAAGAPQVAAQPYAPPAAPPSGTVMRASPPPQARRSGPQLPRSLVVALVLLALGAPLVALGIRWYQGTQGIRVESIDPIAPAAPAAGPPQPGGREASRPATAPSPAGPRGPGAAARLPTQKDGKDPAAAARPTDPPTRPRLCYIRIESTPPGARVERDGAAIGVTPFVDSMPYGSTPLRYRVLADGYEPFEKTVLPEHRRTINVPLRPLSDAPVRPTAPPRRDSRPRAPGSPPPAPF